MLIDLAFMSCHSGVPFELLEPSGPARSLAVWTVGPSPVRLRCAREDSADGHVGQPLGGRAAGGTEVLAGGVEQDDQVLAADPFGGRPSRLGLQRDLRKIRQDFRQAMPRSTGARAAARARLTVFSVGVSSRRGLRLMPVVSQGTVRR